MQQESAIDKLGRDRKLEMLFTSMPFGPLANEIMQHEELFAAKYEQDFRQNFAQSPFKDSPAIVCRMSYDPIEMAGDTPTEEELVRHLKEKGLTSLQAEDTPLYEDFAEVYKVVMWLAGVVHAEQVGRVMIARLNPGGHVKPHKDYGPYHDHYDRFHLCAGGKGCLFRCDRETVKMMPGEVWWFHNNDEHEVWNDSDTPRDHVIVDLKLRGDKRVLRTGGDARSVPAKRANGSDPDGALEGTGAGQGEDAAQTPV